jgi:tRNA C32,U32 (ribose-2'-O)-methylase TrmJ
MMHRAELDPREVRILRGILRQAHWARERTHGTGPSEPDHEPGKG